MAKKVASPAGDPHKGTNKTVSYFVEEMKPLLGEFYTAVGKIGGMLKEASATLSNADYMEFRRQLKSFGWYDALFEAAEAVFEGKLLPQMVVTKVKPSKVIHLDLDIQQQLVDGEPFELIRADDSIYEKTWSEMTSREANQLLGPKGGRILSPTEQHAPKGSGGNKTIIVYKKVSAMDVKLALETENGQYGEISTDLFLTNLKEKGQLEDLEKKIAEFRRRGLKVTG
jgi:hypothetical protein